jgi:tetratricopeptide (TPR) repeat protein
MGRLLVILLLLNLPGMAQLKQRNSTTEPSGAVVEEDEDIVAPTEYVFNPIEAQKDIKIGDFYTKKGNHRAAAARYLEATRWNPGLAEAYWKLGHARDKLKQAAEALEAYRKYIELDPDGKQTHDAKKRVSELEAQQEKLPMTHEAATEKDASPSEQAEKPQQ